MATKKFTGILPALVTPLCADNKTIDIPATDAIIEHLIGQGANGFYILGGTGEGLLMTREDREIMCEAAVKAVKGRVPIINHIASINVDEAVALAKHAEKMGCDAIAAVPPCFFHYGEEDLYNYYKTLADAVHIPVIIYYHPGAQKSMSAKLIAHVFEIDNVTGVKWSSDNLFEMMRLKDMTHGEMNIINGPDQLLVSGLAAGADAGIGSTYNVMLPEFLKIYDAVKRGDMKTALETQLKVNRVIDVNIKHEVISSVKYMCGMMGFPVGNPNPPLRAYTPEQAAQLEKDAKAAGWPFV